MRLIPIHAQPEVGFSDCEEGTGEVPRLDLPLERRGFLKGSGVLVGTLALGSPLLALAPSRVWAVELKSLNKAEGQAILKMGRVLFPHKKLPDAVYALLSKDMDAAAAADPKTAAMLKDGVAALEQGGGRQLRQGAGRPAGGGGEVARGHTLLRGRARQVHHLAL